MNRVTLQHYSNLKILQADDSAVMSLTSKFCNAEQSEKEKNKTKKNMAPLIKGNDEQQL